MRLRLQLFDLVVGGGDFLFELLTATKLGDQVAGRLDVFRQPVLLAVRERRFDLRAVFVVARAMDFQLVLGRGHHLLGRFDRAGLRRELLDDVGRDPRRDLAGAGPFVTKPLVFARQPGFEVFHLVGQFGRQPLHGLQPVLLFEQCFEPLAVADEHIVDAQPLGFFVKLVALAFENVALPLVLFDPLVEVVERGDRAFFERAKIGESLELIVDLAAFDPQRLDADRDFQPAGADGDRFGLGLPRIDFFGQLAKLHRRLGPAAAFGHELIELAVQLLSSRNKRTKLRLLFPRVEQPQARAFEHVDHIVERDAIQARG